MSDIRIEKMQLNYYIDAEIPTTNASVVHVMKMCQALKRNNVDVTLFCNGRDMTVDLETIYRQYGVIDRFSIETVYIPEFLRKHGHRFGAYYSAWLKSKNKKKSNFTYSRSAMSLFFLKNKTEYIYEAHLEPDVLNKQIEYKILKHKNCRGLVVISQALKNRYLEMFPFLLEKNIAVLHDAADIDISESVERAPLKAQESEIKIGYVGSLFPGKCMETLLQLAVRCPQFKFHVVGGTSEWIDYWEKKAIEKKVNNLIFYGFVDNSKLGDFYRAFDICILPFSSNIHIGKSKRVDIAKWTSPLKLFEAMSYAKPIIVSRLATIEEVMFDQKDCVMVEPDNIDEWEKKLVNLCADANLQKRIGQAAKEKLIRQYTWEERARKIVTLIQHGE